MAENRKSEERDILWFPGLQMEELRNRPEAVEGASKREDRNVDR